MLKLFDNCNILNENGSIIAGRLLLLNDTISAVLEPDQEPDTPPELIIDLENRAVFPGLINIHDHLFDSFYPKFECPPVQSWYEWEEKFKTSKVFRDMQKLSVVDLYALGMYRNVLSGVTTVVDHFPREVSSTFFDSPIISFLENYFLAHSASPKHLEWGLGLEEEHALARGVVPFILHVAEGFTEELMEEVETLDSLEILGSNTILVNGPGLSERDLAKIAESNSSFVWCPTSADTVFGRQPPIANILAKGIRCAIATDRAITGPVNLLDELRVARTTLSEIYEKPFDPFEVFKLATLEPAHILGLDRELSTIQPGKLANLLVFPINSDPDNPEDPDITQDALNSFFNLQPDNLSMVLHRGNLVYGDECFRSACSADFNYFSEVVINGRQKLLFGKPLQLLDRIAHKLGEEKSFPFLPLQL